MRMRMSAGMHLQGHVINALVQVIESVHSLLGHALPRRRCPKMLVRPSLLPLIVDELEVGDVINRAAHVVKPTGSDQPYIAERVTNLSDQNPELVQIASPVRIDTQPPNLLIKRVSTLVRVPVLADRRNLQRTSYTFCKMPLPPCASLVECITLVRSLLSQTHT